MKIQYTFENQVNNQKIVKGVDIPTSASQSAEEQREYALNRAIDVIAVRHPNLTGDKGWALVDLEVK